MGPTAPFRGATVKEMEVAGGLAPRIGEPIGRTPLDRAEAARAGVALIAGGQTPEGAYPASPTFSAYRGYCWFRDGSFIADAMSAAGHVESSERFFDWCAAILRRRADHIHWIAAETASGRPPRADQMLPTRFTFDGRDGEDEWWDFQSDGYGTWLWALGEHCRRHGADPDRWGDAVDLTVEYLRAAWRRDCYDWWEEFPDHRHTSSVACVAAGLEAAATVLGRAGTGAGEAAQAARRMVVEEGSGQGLLVKWRGSTAVDGSLAAAIAPLSVIDPASSLAAGTIAAVEQRLAVGGGVHRYLGDTFFGGGLWPILSCFLGLAHAARGERGRAEELLDWSIGTATAEGWIPEQVADHLIAPGMRQAWVDKWGPVATPLLWSHAMVVRLATELESTPSVEEDVDK